MSSKVKKAPARKSARPAVTGSPSRKSGRRRVLSVDCVIVDVSKVNFNVSRKWRKRLKELDDYQRAAPFVFGRLALG